MKSTDKVTTKEEYYDNGVKKSIQHYNEGGKEVGKWEGWHENGQRKYIQHYKNGKPVGIWEKWLDNGSRISWCPFLK